VAAITEALTEYRTGAAELRSHDEVMARLEAKVRARPDDAHPLA
jgi:hypothetical protein